MKQKLKKFYQDNERLILVGAGLVVGSTLTALVADKVIDGMQLADVNLYTVTATGDQFLRVDWKNGTHANYQWDPNRK